MEEGSEEDEEDEDEEEGWRLVSKGIGECERAGAVRSMGGKEGGESKGVLELKTAGGEAGARETRGKETATEGAQGEDEGGLWGWR